MGPLARFCLTSVTLAGLAAAACTASPRSNAHPPSAREPEPAEATLASSPQAAPPSPEERPRPSDAPTVTPPLSAPALPTPPPNAIQPLAPPPPPSVPALEDVIAGVIAAVVLIETPASRGS